MNQRNIRLLRVDYLVVFTFQTEGRCNYVVFGVVKNAVVLPFKQKADATNGSRSN